jgi:PAS domain S-box-containing protein
VETLVRILIVDDDMTFVQRIRDLVSHPQIAVDDLAPIPESINEIRLNNKNSPIYLFGSVCNRRICIRDIIECNISGCLENDEGIRSFVKKVNSLCRHKAKLREAGSKLDCLKSGDLKTLARQLKKTESERFVDYIQNHPLPMILVSRESDILHANSAMEKMIGTKLPGMSATMFWMNPEEFERAVFDLKEKGQILGRETTLKNVHGEQLRVKLYTSLHSDKNGNWLNTRCLFVPIDSLE